LEAKLALPVGTCDGTCVSVTVAVHAVELASGNVEGTQATAVVVVSGGGAKTVNDCCPELARKDALATSAAVTVAGPCALGVYVTEHVEVLLLPVGTSEQLAAGLNALDKSTLDVKSTVPVGEFVVGF
jgi:hypothetical protein